VEQQQPRRCPVEAAADEDLLLVAAAEDCDRAAQRTIADGGTLREVTRRLAPAPPPDHAETRDRRQPRSQQVLLDRTAQEEPLGLAIVRDEVDAREPRLDGIAEAQRRVVGGHRDVRAGLEAGECAEHLTGTGADLPGKRGHLPGSELQAEPLYSPRNRHVL